MSGGSLKSLARSESEFPAPPKFGIWWNRSRFQIYRTLSLVKSSITNDTDHKDLTRSDARIYEHTGESWELIYEIPRGSKKSEHELWAQGPAPKTLAVSDASVEAAIASIMNSTNSTNRTS